jgi:anti-sigma factor RsiW
MMTGELSDGLLQAYLDGTLDDAAMTEVEAVMNANPAIAERMAALSGDDRAIRAAYADILAAPVPDHLANIVRGAPERGDVVDFAAFKERKERRSSWGWPQGAAIAASLMIGLVAGGQLLPGNNGAGTALVVASADGARLAPAATAFLSQAKSGVRTDLAALGTAEVTISFRSGDGALCRQFAVEQRDATIDAVACRAGSAWRVEALGARADAGGGEMQTASGDAAPGVNAAVDALIAGDPLDAEAETKALAELR